MSTSQNPVLELRDVSIACDDAPVLRGLSLTISPGVFHTIADGSAAARSALLRVLGLLDAPMSGEVLMEGRATAGMHRIERDELRNRRCGFLFSAPFLLPTFSAVENVAMPIFKISQLTPELTRERTNRFLEFAGLADDGGMPADTLTLFQQHAVSLARALANEPAIITVETPDAGLAPKEAVEFAKLLRAACAQFGVAIIAAMPADFANDPADRILAIADCEMHLEGKPPA